VWSIAQLAFAAVRLANKAPRGGYFVARVAAKLVPGLRNFPIPTIYGPIVCDLRESVCWPLVRYGRYPHWSEDEAGLPTLGISSDSIILDVGANLGATVLQYARLAKHVHAFEPSPRALKFLRQNVEHLANVTIHPVALGDRVGTAYFEEEAALDISHLSDEGLEVPMKTVDSLDLRPDFIKIDVEGFEHLVLAGARETLKTGPTVIFEALDQEAVERNTAILQAANPAYRVRHVGGASFNYIAATR
jgi:FkbM family methyltransferase